MPDSGIPEAVERFLSAHVRSVEQLDVLLLLRATKDRDWSAAEVSREIGSSVASIQARLADLVSSGLLGVRVRDAEPIYRYEPPSEELRRLMDELALTYRQRRLRVICQIYAQPTNDGAGLADSEPE